MYEFPFTARYVAVRGEEPGDVFALLWLDFARGVSIFRDQRHEVPATRWGTYVHLAPDQTMKTMFLPRSFGHAAANEMEFSPLPPPDAPWSSGARSAEVRAIKVGGYDYRTQWNWQLDAHDGLVRRSWHRPTRRCPSSAS